MNFTSIKDLNPSILLDIRYATENNFTGKIVYPRAGCYLRKEAAFALNNAQNDLNKQGYGLKIFDAYRPHPYQELFWQIMPDERYVANPIVGSKHNRGAAVDLTLIRLSDNLEIEMPSAFDDFSEKAHRIYENMTPQAAAHCRLLEKHMTKHGFTGLPTEWWHFDFNGWENYAIEKISFDEIDQFNCTLL